MSPDEVQLFLLLFADNTVLLSDTVIVLQNRINVLITFVGSYNMKVNMAKTKIVVFRKGGHLARNESWTFGETAIEVVNAYEVFSNTGAQNVSNGQEFKKCKVI